MIQVEDNGAELAALGLPMGFGKHTVSNPVLITTAVGAFALPIRTTLLNSPAHSSLSGPYSLHPSPLQQQHSLCSPLQLIHPLLHHSFTNCMSQASALPVPCDCMHAATAGQAPAAKEGSTASDTPATPPAAAFCRRPCQYTREAPGVAHQSAQSARPQ
jgi:hypothetical protein